MPPRSPLRMIDANLNRACEAVRTLEDLARFVLDLEDSASELKSIRHEITRVAHARGWDTVHLAPHRDTPGDRGTVLSTPCETHRSSLAAIAQAASSRGAQALRVLEETAKLPGSAPPPHHPSPLPPRERDDSSLTASHASDFEQLRYRLYDAAQRVVLALGSGRGAQWKLCVLITEAACCEMAWERVAALACEGGAEALQLREPELADGALLRRAHTFVSICREHGVASIINNRADLALLAGADGVHVGQSDLPIESVRELAGSRLLIGISTSNTEQATRAARQGADYCGIGPIFPSTTKPKPDLAGIDVLKSSLSLPELAQLPHQLPHLAISGITKENVGMLVQAGCRGIAVCAPVCGSDDPRRATQELVEAMSPSINDSPIDSAHGS